MNTTIQVRVDSKTKKAAQAVFEDMGLDLSSGVKMYLAQVVREKGLPFTPHTVNGLTPAHEVRIIQETEWAEKHGKRYKSAAAAMRDILK
jgi:DNA-damage-inducible protein J